MTIESDVLEVDCSSVDGTDWPARLTDLVVHVTTGLGRGDPAATGALTVVAWTPAAGEPRSVGVACAVAAVRSLVQASALERPELRANLVVACPEDRADVADTLAYLAGQDGGFAHGATIDLAGRAVS